MTYLTSLFTAFLVDRLTSHIKLARVGLFGRTEPTLARVPKRQWNSGSVNQNHRRRDGRAPPSSVSDKATSGSPDDALDGVDIFSRIKA